MLISTDRGLICWKQVLLWAVNEFISLKVNLISITNNFQKYLSDLNAVLLRFGVFPFGLTKVKNSLHHRQWLFDFKNSNASVIWMQFYFASGISMWIDKQVKSSLHHRQLLFYFINSDILQPARMQTADSNVWVRNFIMICSFFFISIVACRRYSRYHLLINILAGTVFNFLPVDTWG